MVSRSRGFTLIELLVVVAIIVILMAILQPALAKARASAKTVKCLAHLRQIGISIRMYADENNGYFPYGRAQPTTPVNMQVRNTWYTNLSPYLTAGLSKIDVLDPATPPTSEAVRVHNLIWQKLRCPSETLDQAPGIVQGVLRRTYGIHMAVTYPDPKTGKTYPFDSGYGLQDYMTGSSRKYSSVGASESAAISVADTNDVEYVYATMWNRLSIAQQNLYLPARHNNGYGAAFVDGHAELIPAAVLRNPADRIWKLQ